jgi:hypothetical protein
MPLYHVMGNFTDGDGEQPVSVNDVSSIIQYHGVFHVFHQFGQCGWAHALSYDGAHWKNARYTLTPDYDQKHIYDQCGCYDGSLTFAPGVNGGGPVILYSNSPSIPTTTTIGAATNGADTNVTSGDRPIMAVARPTDLSDPELRHWTKDPQNPVSVRCIPLFFDFLSLPWLALSRSLSLSLSLSLALSRSLSLWLSTQPRSAVNKGLPLTA